MQTYLHKSVNIYQLLHFESSAYNSSMRQYHFEIEKKKKKKKREKERKKNKKEAKYVTHFRFTKFKIFFFYNFIKQNLVKKVWQ